MDVVFNNSSNNTVLRQELDSTFNFKLNPIMASLTAKSGCSFKEAYFGDGISGTSNVATLISIFTNLFSKRIPIDGVKMLVENLVGQAGVIASFTNLFSKMGQGTATNSDILGTVSTVGQFVTQIAELAVQRIPHVMIALTMFDIANLLYQWWSCEPKKELPNKDKAEQTTSPLVIDLDFNGIQTTPLGMGVYFDLDNNGFAESTAWAKYTDGVLALDKNKNGTIDNGNEIFGNNTSLKNGDKAENGFEALKEFDTDKNGVIDANDEVWDELVIWQDYNGDGFTQENELRKIDDIGIQSIDLNYKETNEIDFNGNEARQQSKVKWKDGRESQINDIWFKVDLSDTQDYTSIGNISDEQFEVLVTLPIVDGFGNLKNLTAAMASNPTLLLKVQNYLNANSEQRNLLLNDLIYEWVGCIDVDPNSRDPKQIYGHVMDARQLITLEVLTGSGYEGIWCWNEKDPNPHGQAAPILIAEYTKFANYVRAYLSAQWDYPELFDSLFLKLINDPNQNTEYENIKFNSKIFELFQSGNNSEITSLIKIFNELGTYNAVIKSLYESNLDKLLISAPPSLINIITDKWIFGTSAADVLTGSMKDEVFVAGAGNDLLFGDKGNDKYQFGIGFGSDRIYDSGGSETIVFIDEISPGNIKVSRNLTSVYLTVLNIDGTLSDDVIQIDNFYGFDGKTAEGLIEFVHFKDGTIWTWQDIARKLQPIATQNDDKLFLGQEDNIIDGLGGDDEIFGGDGNDSLLGGDGNDRIYGDHGNDSLDGGGGDDYLNGGYGNDTYIFERSWGSDTIIEVDKNNTISFKGISASELSLHRQNNHLVILQIGTSNQITINNQFVDGASTTDVNKIIQIVFENGEIWDANTIKQKSLIGTANSDVLYGFVDNDVIHGADGNDTIYGAKGNDVLFGDGGDDWLQGGDGNDTLIGGEGNDTLYGDQGNDTYVFSANWGSDHIRDYDSNNTIRFEGLLPSELQLYRENNSLIISQIGTDNKITILNQLVDTDTGTNLIAVPRIEFENGVVWNAQTIKEMAVIGTDADNTIYGFVDADKMHGGKGNDILYGAKGDDLLYGELGNDQLHGEAGNDHLFGAEGEDLLYGGIGNDTLEGGTGNDTLIGGLGSDTYVFAKGWGQDTVEGESNWTKTESDVDTIHFDGILPSELLVRNVNGDMVIQRLNSNDQLHVSGQFAPYNNIYTINQITFANGTVWNIDTINKMAVKGTGNDDVIQGVTYGDIIHGGDGNDTIEGTFGNPDDPVQNQIFGEAGNDTLSGTGLLDGGIGDDYINGQGQLYGGEGNDTLEGSGLLDGGNGNDILTGTGQLYGQDGDDEITGQGELYGGNGADTLLLDSYFMPSLLDGGAGNDILDAGQGQMQYLSLGDDIAQLYADREASFDGVPENERFNYLKGGTGNDSLYGSYSDEIYLFNLGDGQDTIIERRMGEAYTNVLDSYDIVRFGAGISATDITYYRSNKDLILKHSNGTDQITVQNYFVEYSNSSIDHFKINEVQFDDGTRLTSEQIENAIIYLGTAQNDTLWGYRNRDETFMAGNGDDTIIGGLGNDTLNGGAGNDKYYYYLGDGQDTIDQTGGGTDVLWLMDQGITQDRIGFSKIGNDLLITIDEDSNNTIRVKDHFLGGEKAISKVQPNGGYAITAVQIAGIIKAQELGGQFDQVIEGTANGETLYGTAQNDLIQALAGNDNVYAGAGNDRLEGGEGNDTLYGQDGDDVLIGGAGNDILAGGMGNDVLDGGAGDDDYYWNLSDGPDIINQTGGGSDTLWIMDQGVTADRLKFTKDGNDLLMTVDNNSQQSVRIKDHFLGGEKAISKVQPNGGYAITAAQIAQLVGGGGTTTPSEYDKEIVGTANADSLTGTSGKDLIQGLAGNDQLFGMGGNDRLEGGAGDDYLSGGNGSGTNSGNDTLIGGDGVDTLYGEDGDDRLEGGLGNDKYLYRAGHGVDTVVVGGGSDMVFFQEIAQTRLSYHKDGNDLVILVDGDLGQQVRVENHFLGGNNALAGVVPSSNTVISAATIANNLTAMPGTGGGNPSTDPQTIIGTNGNDTLQGGLGNDTLNGGLGNDTYIYTAGIDTITEAGGTDTLVFSNGITFDQASTFGMYNNKDLIIKIGGSNDNQVVIKDFFVNGDRIVEEFQYAAEGYVISAQQIFDMYGIPMPSGSGGGTTEPSPNTDFVATAGNDHYLYTSGAKVIKELGGNDTLTFGNGIQFSQVGNYLTKSGNDLILKVNGQSTNQVTIKDFFLGGTKVVETIKFETGGSISADQIFGAFGLSNPNPASAAANTNSMVSAMAAFGTGNGLDASAIPSNYSVANNALYSVSALS